MRYCPTCRTQYTDDTLRFCLQDGAVLVERAQADTPTVAFQETPTIERRADSQVTSWRQETETETQAASVKEKRSRTPVLISFAAIAVVLLFVVGAGAVGLWLYLTSGRTVATANNTANVSNINNQNGNLSGFFPSPTPRTTPSVSPMPKQTPVPLPSPTPQGNDRERSRQEVSQTVHGWKSMAESLDLNSYMANYADTVDYYNRSGASRNTVRNDKARAFGMYRSMRITLTNMNVSVDESGTRATAEFDKEWDFRGSKNSSGKVRSQLRFRLSNNQWLIIGERDSKVYYVN